MSNRDYNAEYEVSEDRKYSYLFDDRLREYFIRTFRDDFKPDGNVLEIGCYQGDFTTKLLEEFSSVTVLDASSDSLAVVKDRFGDKVKRVEGIIQNTDFDESFDTIFIVHTLEHLDTPIDDLKRIGRWLKPGGRLYVVVPNANAASRQIAVQMGVVDYNSAVTEAEHIHGHRATYSLDTLTSVVRKADLNIVRTGGVFFKPLANYQFDGLAGSDLLSPEFYEGCYQLGFRYPDLSASVYAVVERP